MRLLHSSRFRYLVAVLLCAVLLGSAGTLVKQRTDGQRSVVSRFADRSRASAQLLGSLVLATTARSQDETQAGMTRVLSEQNAAAAAVFDRSGKLLVASSQKRELLSVLREGLASRNRLTGILALGGGRVIDQVVQTRKGHVLVIASAVSNFSQALRRLVAGLVTGIPFRGYIVDAGDRVISSNEPTRATALLPALPSGWTTAGSMIPGTQWRVVIRTSRSALYSTLRSSAIEWVLLAFVSVLSVALLGFAARLSRQRAELAAVNAELKDYTEQLIQSNAELEQFAFATSHDLQQPLRVIIQFAAILHDESYLKLNDDERENLDFIHHSAMQMAGVVERLLDFSRLNQHEKPMRYDVVDSFAGALEDLQEVIREADITVKIRSSVTLCARPVQIRQAVRNLLGNSIKYRRPNAPGGPQVTLSAERDGGDVLIRCLDNGIGIPREHFERIFLMGIQGRLHREDEYPGAGVGLVLVKKIAEVHGGTVEVISTVGVGSAFTMRLPDERRGGDGHEA